jgi:single-strand DNA-binding protein
MKDLNKVLLIGRLGNDPIRRETKTGKAVANFSLATSRLVPDGEAVEEGEEPGKREETDWHSVVVWGRQAEVCYQFLRKGRMVYVEGSIRRRSYTNKEGQQRISFEVHADSVGFLNGFGSSSLNRESESEAAVSEAAAS